MKTALLILTLGLIALQVRNLDQISNETNGIVMHGTDVNMESQQVNQVSGNTRQAREHLRMAVHTIAKRSKSPPYVPTPRPPSKP